MATVLTWLLTRAPRQATGTVEIRIFFGPREINGVEVDPLIGWCLTYLLNFTGHPAASVPAGLVGGLPVGMQIIGGRYADTDVLAASAAFERARPWRDTYLACHGRRA